GIPRARRRRARRAGIRRRGGRAPGSPPRAGRPHPPLGGHAMAPALRKLGRSIERLVGSDVHPGEWHMVLLFFINLFLLLTAYYILKVIREPLILMGGGAVSRSYARGMQAGLLFLVIPAYSVLANRVEP